MGKIKTKYPVEVNIDFYMFLLDGQNIQDNIKVLVNSSPLTYQNLQEAFMEFLINHEIKYEAYMFIWNTSGEDGEIKEELIENQFTMDINEVLELHGGTVPIIVKSYTQYLKDMLFEQLQTFSKRISDIEEKMILFQKKEEDDSKVHLHPSHPLPFLHTNSFPPQAFEEKELDIGILFSEPIFDQRRRKEASFPVDFRSEIQRLRSALTNSYKPEITLRCQIGTKQNFKHLIDRQKPKILHIICHGSRDGNLEFQDDSKYALGTLNTINSDSIRKILEDQKDCLPKLVFINSCFSESVGKVFYEAGVKYVIMIDSQDKIDDEAAQIFSQNFYRNIFKGEKVGFSFREAKDTVSLKHNSFGCCCRHSSKEKHKQNCRWQKIAKDIGDTVAHELYHIPSEKCVCELRNHNRHKATCQWARFSLFHINNDFRIKGENGEYFPKKPSEFPSYLPVVKKERQLIICCCFNFEGAETEFKLPHSQSNKFKMLPQEEQNTQSLYQLQKNMILRSQIIDYSAPELIEVYEKVQNICVMGRQQELYEFMKNIIEQQLSIFLIKGASGIGKTSFGIKSATYLMERLIFENYFFIDLYEIRSKDMFRCKFNEITKLGYGNPKNSVLESKNRKMIMVLDNSDDFFINSPQQFYSQLDALKKQYIHTKFIITCKESSFSNLEIERLKCQVKTLGELKPDIAAKALFYKIRNYVDISVQFLDIRGLVAAKKQLQIPKVIQNLAHTFASNSSKKMKVQDLKNKILVIDEGDTAFNTLIEMNMEILKRKCPQSYQILIFISQFSQGVDANDFSILSMYDKQSEINLPFDKNWKKYFAVLFEKHLEADNQVTTKESQTDSLESHSSATRLEKHTTLGNEMMSDVESDNQDLIMKGDSYFLQELSQNRFIVKRFIRDFIWNKDRSEQNYYMKHLFIAYTAVMLDVYLQFLIDQKYIHEELMEYNDISKSGFFYYKDNNYLPTSLTQSVRLVEKYNNELEKILKEHPTIKEKIKNSDPSIFIMNHKLDFLHIYSFDWTLVYKYIIDHRDKEKRIFLTYIQKLITLIPTALKIADAEESLIQYSISKSLELLSKLREYTDCSPSQILLLTLKLKLMKASLQLQKNQESSLPNLDFQGIFHKHDLEKISSSTLTKINTQWRFEVKILEMYKQYLNTKDFKRATELIYKGGLDRLNDLSKSIANWIAQEDDWRDFQTCEILMAKRKLIIVLIYYNFLQGSSKYMSTLPFVTFKKNNVNTILSYAEESAKIFQYQKLTKLCFRAKMIGLSISWQQIGKTRSKLMEIGDTCDKQLEEERQKLKECEEIYENRKNNLIGLTNFDILMKKLRKQMKQRMWQQSVNNFIFMKAVPLSFKKKPILQNIIRKKQTYEKDIQKILSNTKIDINVKFQILSVETLAEQTKKGSTILLLNTHFKIYQNDKVFIAMEGDDLTETEIEINAEFIEKFPVWNAKLLILMGSNAKFAQNKICKLMKNPTQKISTLLKTPPIISITSSQSSQFDEFEDFSYQQLSERGNELQCLIQQLKDVSKAQIACAKELIKALMNSKKDQKLKQIVEQIKNQFVTQLKCVEMFVESGKEGQILDIKMGNCRDLSPSFRKTHNIDMQFKSAHQCIYRKWKQINQIFKELNNNPNAPKYINVYGQAGSGKTTFTQQLGRMFVERGMFESGVYIIKGKELQEKFYGDFQSYIIKNSQTGSIFNMQSFNKYANSHFMLIIDDFDLIKPKSNGRYAKFMKNLITKKINIMMVTHERYANKDIFQKVKAILIEKMNDLELKIFAYNVLDLQNQNQIDQFESLQSNRVVTAKAITDIVDKYKVASYSSFTLKPPQQDMKKIISNLL